MIFHRIPHLTAAVTLAWACIATSGCRPAAKPTQGQASTSSQVPLQIVEGEVPSEAQQQSMLAAKDELFSKLSGRLMEVTATAGPVAAIAVCKNEASQIAENVGRSRGLKIGRIGVRLRNPNNQPPSWAVAMTEIKMDKPQFVSLTTGEAAALLPIKLQAQCLMCHGPRSQIPAPIQEQLAKLYPGDEATGFTEGELRGWFWIQMPTN